MKKDFNKILFVINPTSGTGINVDYEPDIKRHSESSDFKYLIYYTTGINDSGKLKNHINDFNPEMVIAVGGDGTINVVASLLVGTEMILGIIPVGSANGLAFNLNIPTNFESALGINLQARIKAIDVLLINDERFCFHLSDLGINARIVKRYEQEGSKGLSGYGKQLLKELFLPKSTFSFQLTTDSVSKNSKAELLIFTNAHSFGTGVIINPTGDLSDGLFEIVVIRPYPWWFIFTFIVKGFTGNLHKVQYVKVYKTSRAEIKLKHYQDFQIDGEIQDKTKSLKIELIKNSLNVVFPG